MGRRYQKSKEKHELISDFSYQIKPEILTASGIRRILTSDQFYKAAILLPANNLKTLEDGELELTLQSDNIFENGTIKKQYLMSNYFAEIISQFQTSRYLEFAILSANKFQEYTPKKKVVNFYKKNSHQKTPLSEIRMDQINPKGSLSSNFQISPIRTAQDLQKFQTSDKPKQFYMSLGKLVQKNSQSNLDPKYIQEMSLQFIDNLHNFRSDDTKSRQMKTSIQIGKLSKSINVRQSLEFKLDENQIPKVIF